MRYWVYINDKVEGPYEEDKLVTLQGFTPDTLICTEEVAAGSNQEWVKASSIFEFDQIEQTINQPFSEKQTWNDTPVNGGAVSSVQTDANSNLNNLLLEKIDLLTREITGLQLKLDDMKNKLDTAFVASQYNRPESSSMQNSYIPPEDNAHNTITLTQHDINPTNEEALITNTQSLVSQAENIVAAAKQEKIVEEKPLDMLGPVDLGEKKEQASPTEVTLGSKAEEEVVLRSALDSLYNAKAMEQSQEEKESTFQDLLTPQQAEVLAAQADALQKQQKSQEKPSLDKVIETVQKEDAALAADELAKDALLNELTAEPKEDILDKVIKEREEEKKEETFKMAQAAAAGVAAGVAAAEILDKSVAEQPKQEEASGLETVQEVTEEPLPEKLTLDFTAQTQEPALSIATDPEAPEKLEEVKPANEMPGDIPQEKPKQINNEEHLSVLPENDDFIPESQPEINTEKKEEIMQELVPGAKMEKPDNILIMESDLNEAFRERNNKASESVEELFGIEPAKPIQNDPNQEQVHMPQFSDQTADKPLPVGNSDDLTEIELKEGSTYLISDFVPPAQTGKELPKELHGLDKQEYHEASVPAEKASVNKDQEPEVEEIVSSLKQTEKPLEPAKEVPQDVSVSQIILENTIKTKRGATLDIKTVPMVPEPAQSERLNLENMDDDINTQHDLKSADAKPAHKMTKVIMGSIVAVILAAIIYVMLAFMNLIPAQFNLLAAKQASQQDVQLEEILPNTEPNTPTAESAVPAAPVNPMDSILLEVKNFPLFNGYTLQQFIEAKHLAAKDLITWDISTAVDPDNYSVLVKVPPENPQSFKISYRFNYNTVTKTLDPTISDAKNLLDSIAQGTAVMPQGMPSQMPVQTSQTVTEPVPAGGSSNLQPTTMPSVQTTGQGIKPTQANPMALPANAVPTPL